MTATVGRPSRTVRYGIEVASGVTWREWEPGGEYTKQLTLKNVKFRTQKISYKLPESRHFTSLYPQPIVLSAGTSFALPLTFRPGKKANYEEAIVFETTEGQFDVAMRAVLPQAKLSVPDSLNFGMCAVEDITTITFQIANTSDVDTTFVWSGNEPFSLEPDSGFLPSRSSFIITATFSPTAAKVYEGLAVCRFGDEDNQSRTVKVEGIGKFPHLMVSVCGSKPKERLPAGTNDVIYPKETLIDFGQVAVETTAEKWIELRNQSPVNAPFHITQSVTAISTIDSVFCCSHYRGVVSPQSTEKVKVTFSPHTPDAHSVDYFKVKANGSHSCVVMKCKGIAKGPIIRLNTTCLPFGTVNSGDTATRTFDVENHSDVMTAFQFQIGADSVFALNTLCGVLKPQVSQTIIVHFKPLHPISYHRKLACLVHNQEPIFIHLIGTCNSEQVKPAPLQSKHVNQYEVRLTRGLSYFPPEQLNEMLKEGQLTVDDKGTLTQIESLADQSVCKQQTSTSGWDELFKDMVPGMMCVSHVSLEVDCVDFGACKANKSLYTKTVNLTNHTKGKITCHWMTNLKDAFYITPEDKDVLPGKSCSFTITFKPTVADQFYDKELECFAFYKSMSDYRLVSDVTTTLPWCLTLAALGHTFASTSETFLPQMTTSSNSLLFAPISVGQTGFRTLLLRNTGDTPIKFLFDVDSEGPFTCKPSQGLLCEEYQVAVFCMKPTAVRMSEQTVQLRINEDRRHTRKLTVTGSAEDPSVTLENEGTLYFKPTCLGTVSSRSFRVKNTSRLPVNFSWHIPGDEAEPLRVQPSRGTLLPNEHQCHVWSFIPAEVKKYGIRCGLTLGNGCDLTASPKRVGLLAIGEGTVGEIECTPRSISFGNVVVGSSSHRELTVYNASECSLQYKLTVQMQKADNAVTMSVPSSGKQALLLDSYQGVLPSRARKTLTVTGRPGRRVKYNFKIFYELRPTTDAGCVNCPATELCSVTLNGVFPTLSISDVRGQGCASSWSKARLWEMLHLTQLNQTLVAEPTPAEQIYAVATRHSTRRRPTYHTRAVVSVDFGTAPLKSEPCILHLMLENSGDVKTDWTLLFPPEMQLELEYWAETGELNPEEACDLHLMDNEVFSVSPREGRLSPGERQTLTVTYRHAFAGCNKLPVLLKIAHGREVLLHFTGVTVNPGQLYVHFPSFRHVFDPVPVGVEHPPVQAYELHNGGAEPVGYEIDTSLLKQLKEENFDCPVLTCLRPSGHIPAGRSVAIPWLFSPLEARTYSVDVSIHIINGKTSTVTFVGVGYDHCSGRSDGEDSAGRLTTSAIPEKQLVPVEGQLAYLSCERLDFGDIPLYSTARRIVCLTNSSTEDTLSFTWLLHQSKEAVTIEPFSGILAPQEKALIKISLCSKRGPCYHNLDIECQIVDETAMANYRRNMDAWEEQQELQKHLFTITDGGVPNEPSGAVSQKTGRKTDKGRHASVSMLGAGQMVYRRSDSDLNRYQALPPIGSSPTFPPETYDEWKKRDLSTRSKARPRIGNESTKHNKPTSPQPCRLHLGLTARTHDIRDFVTQFGEPTNFLIDVPSARHTLHAGAPAISEYSSEVLSRYSHKASQSLLVTREENEVITTTMNDVVRSLLDDPSFHRAVNAAYTEPVPYFTQLRSKEIERDVREFEEKREEGKFRSGERAQKVESASSAEEVPHTSQANDGEARWKASRASPKQKAETQSEDHVLRLPEARSLVETVLENTLFNMMCEAEYRELSLTSKQLALPSPITSV